MRRAAGPGAADRSGEPGATPAFPPIPTPPRRRFRLWVGVAVVAASFAGAVLGGVLVLTFAVGDAQQPASEELEEPPPQASVDPSAEDEPAQSDRVASVAEAVLPTVVRVDIDGGTEDLDDTAGNGSGVVYRDDGHIVTNNHVVQPADELTVVFADGSREDADVVGTDALNDLAVIKVEREDLPVIPANEQTAVRVGELAVAVGSPFGLEGSVTSGVISALDRGIDVQGPGGAALTLPKVVQTDAPINPGNSGGPLVDGTGELIGINSAILTTGQRANAGVGFAIPVDIVVDVVDELIEEGSVAHPFIGIQGQTVSDDRADELDLDGGAEVAEIVDDTPAGDAGLRAGDVVTQFGDADILTMEELVTTVLEFDVGEEVSLHFIRDGDEHTVDVELGERPEDGEES